MLALDNAGSGGRSFRDCTPALHYSRSTMKLLIPILLALTLGCRILPTSSLPHRPQGSLAAVTEHNGSTNYNTPSITLAIAEDTSLVFTCKVTGYGQFGQPGGWYVVGLFNTAVQFPFDEWEYRLESAYWGDPPTGKVQHYLVNPYSDEFIQLIDTKYPSLPPPGITLRFPSWRLPVGTVYWFDVHAIDANGNDGGVIDGGDFVGTIGEPNALSSAGSSYYLDQPNH